MFHILDLEFLSNQEKHILVKGSFLHLLPPLKSGRLKMDCYKYFEPLSGSGDRSSDDWVPVQRWRPELWRSRNHAWSSQVCHHHYHDPHKHLTFNWNCRTFEAASSQSFSGGNVVNKKTVYSRKEANVPGQKKSWLKIILFKNAIASHALLCSFIFFTMAFFSFFRAFLGQSPTWMGGGSN